jgi:hypothetical protein
MYEIMLFLGLILHPAFMTRHASLLVVRAHCLFNTEPLLRSVDMLDGIGHGHGGMVQFRSHYMSKYHCSATVATKQYGSTPVYRRPYSLENPENECR